MEQGITKISVAGFKSIAEEVELGIKPLTLLAGANSSGKSSFMQPLLLMKQTLEWEPPFSPKPLLLDGPNIKFTSIDQLFSKKGKVFNPTFSVGIYTGKSFSKIRFKKNEQKKLMVDDICVFDSSDDLSIHISPSMTKSQILKQANEIINKLGRQGQKVTNTEKVRPKIVKDRFDLQVSLPGCTLSSFSSRSIPTTRGILQVIHVPGLRGNPQRKYPSNEIWERFPETFEKYAASVIIYWMEKKSAKLRQLCDNLARLGLTSKISAKRLNDVEIEVVVGRLPKNGRSQSDMVSIADVGFGVSQTLPVLVALLVAEPGQLVYLEQPEIHLHPRAQRALAELLVEAANQGVKVVAETHSSMLLLAVQTLIAKQKISPDNVALHWFQRNKAGMTEVSTAKLSEQGTFGDWPVDFGEVELEAEGDYLKAIAEARRGRK